MSDVWTATYGMDNAAHVMPRNDLVEHTADENCICMPTIEMVSYEGTDVVGWMVSHSALDGRE